MKQEAKSAQMVMAKDLGVRRALNSDADFYSFGKIKRLAGHEHSSNESRSNGAGRSELRITGRRRLFFVCRLYMRGGHDRARVQSHISQCISVAILFAPDMLDSEVGKVARAGGGALVKRL